MYSIISLLAKRSKNLSEMKIRMGVVENKNKNENEKKNREKGKAFVAFVSLLRQEQKS